MSSQTHWKQNFNYKYAGAYELAPGEERTLTIQRFSNEEVINQSNKKEVCFVAYFKEHSKPMVLNKTNCKTIEKLYGPIVEDWIGKRITVKSERVRAFGDMVDALRVKKTLPGPEIKKDYSEIINKVQSCTTIDELRSLFESLKPDEKAACQYAKEATKNKLSQPQGVAN